jgi:DNA-binding NarL/FixJ family response regulator
MSDRITIVIAEDHALLRDGVRTLLSQEPDIEIIGETDNGKDAIRIACALHPRLVLMDLSLPGIHGLDAIAEIKRRMPDIKILVVTMHKTDEHINDALRVGASGYFGKDSNYLELLAAIRAVLLGKIYLSPDISERVVSNYFSGETKSASNRDKLSIRENEVLKLIAEGNSNKHMASYLGLSIKTVEKHRASLRHKLGLRNASMLTAYAIEKGIVTQLALARGRDLKIDR